MVCYVIFGKVKLGDVVFSVGEFVFLDDESEIEIMENSCYFFLGGEKMEK